MLANYQLQLQFNASNKFSKEKQRLKFCLKKKEYDGLVSKLQKQNTALSKLTTQTLALEPSRSARQLPDFELIRNYVTSIYKMLCSGLQCACRESHIISLRLEGIKCCFSAVELPPFRVVFSYSANASPPDQTPLIIGTVDIRPMDNESQKSLPVRTRPVKRVSFQAVQAPVSTTTNAQKPTNPPGSVQVKDLCHAMRHFKDNPIEKCMGFLEDSAASQKLGLYQPDTTLHSHNIHQPPLSSLNEILTGSRRVYSGYRRRLAVLLSSNLLQLYRTPWLDDIWSHDEITFLAGEDEGLKYPFISRISTRQVCPDIADSGLSQWDGPIQNRSLFALGILLIELCLERPFADLRTAMSSEKQGLITASDYDIANALLDNVANEYGDWYSSVVRRCIRCTFDTEKLDLDDDEFRKAVYKGVVLPLEDDLKNFRGLSV